MKNIIVTGGAGFIGSNLVDKLIERGYNVTILDNLSTGKQENINKKSKLINLDIANCGIDVLISEFKSNEYIFHLAAKTSVQESIELPYLYNNVNVNGTLNILEAARESKTIKKVIFSSSSAIYGNNSTMPLVENLIPSPISPYSLNKIIGEQYCKLYSEMYNLDTVCLRYFNVFGFRQPINNSSYCNVIGKFISQTKGNKKLMINNDGEQTRDFVHIEDVANANIMAMEFPNNLNGECFNVGTGIGTSVNQIASYFENEKLFNPIQVIEPKWSVSSYEKIKSIIGWVPTIRLSKEVIIKI
jgi:UDP-glucose 4-epimerase